MLNLWLLKFQEPGSRWRWLEIVLRHVTASHWPWSARPRRCCLVDWRPRQASVSKLFMLPSWPRRVWWVRECLTFYHNMCSRLGKVAVVQMAFHFCVFTCWNVSPALCNKSACTNQIRPQSHVWLLHRTVLPGKVIDILWYNHLAVMFSTGARNVRLNYHNFYTVLSPSHRVMCESSMCTLLRNHTLVNE